METVAAVLLLTCLAVHATPPTENLLKNAGFEEVEDGHPNNWRAMEFRTGGTAGLATDGAHTGSVAAKLISKSPKERVCWSQRVPLPAGVKAVAASGWYKTSGFADGSRQGATFRVHFHAKNDGKSREIALKQVFFPASADWSQTPEKKFLVPPETTDVELQVFNWLITGETAWDDAVLRPLADEELPRLNADLASGLGIDKEPIYGKNLPYSPANGETVKTNPPPFLWLPVSDPRSYALQISPTADFAGETVQTIRGIPWCAHMLCAPLQPGTWHWRYGLEASAEQIVWSRARTFIVPESTDPWPYPKMSAFDIPKAHPRLFVNAAELALYRTRAAEGDLKETAELLVRRVAGYADEELVAEPDWLPKGPEHGPAYTLTFRATRPPMDRMEQAALAYLLTGNPDCGEEAKRRILHFFSWDPHGPTNVFHNDEPAMWVMMRGVRAYDWTYDLFSESERTSVEGSITERARDFYKLLSGRPFENNPFASHSGRIIGFLGEAAILLAPEHEEARMWLQYITTIYWGVYPAWGKEDGGWNEGPGYWSAYMSFGLHFVVALKQATGIDLSQRPFFRNTPYYKLYLSPPYSTMSPFGDGTQFGTSRPGALMYAFSSLLHDPRVRWYTDYLQQGSGNGILGIVLKDDTLVGSPPYDLPQGKLFEAVGLVSLHTDFGCASNDVIFTMRSSPYGAVSHGHNDQNCFTLEGYGEPLAIATGYYNRYGSPHHDQWTRQTKAKCGITIDGGKGQDRGWHAKGHIDSFVNGAGFDYIRGDATEAYGGRLDKAIREVIHVRPGIYIIRDILSSAAPRHYEFWLHALDEIEINSETSTVCIRRPSASLEAQFLAPEELTFAQTDEYSVPPTWPPGKKYGKQWHLNASNSVTRKAVTFLTVLTVSQKGEESRQPRIKKYGRRIPRGLELLWPDGRRVVVMFADDLPEGTRDLGGTVTDATVFAVGLDASGQPERWIMRDGSLLAFGDDVLAEADEKGLMTGAKTAFGMQVDAGCNATNINLWCPERVRFSRDLSTGNLDRVRHWGRRLAMALPAGTSSLQLWKHKPPAIGAREVRLKGKHVDTTVTGYTGLSGKTVFSAIPDLSSGLYRVHLDEKSRLTAPGIQSHTPDLFWFRKGTQLAFSSPDTLDTLDLDCLAKARLITGVPRENLPNSLLFEAEDNWQEEGGTIRVSNGGHKHASANNNLWGWNTLGHRICWTITVPEDAVYAIWLIGATETGFMGELRIDDRETELLEFASTGGWGRKRAEEWQAFCLTGSPETAAPLQLPKGKHTIELINRSGMGLNLDAIALVPRTK